jgi:hypothetical protein
MRLKVYFLRIALAVATFVFGVGLFNAGQYLKSFYQTKTPKVEASAVVHKNEFLRVPVISEFTAQTEQAETPEPDYGNGGDYYIADEERKEFKDFESLEIIDRIYEGIDDEKYPYGKPIPPKGFVQATRKYKFTRVSISRTNFAFETEAKKGISYKFIGEFVDESDPSKEFNSDTSIEFRGRLTKMLDGKKISSGKFSFIAGGC